MKRLLIAICTAVFGLGLGFVSIDAEAKRLGGSKSSGMSRWLGPLAGIAAGIGLAALLSHFGLGEGVASFLMMALIAFAVIFVVRMLLKKRQPAQPMQYAGVPDGMPPERFEPAAAPASGAAAQAPSNIPADFDVEGFLRNAKLNFVRLQAANDAGNLDDIRQFTTPEMFAEIKLQFDERGRDKQETDVVQLNAALLDVATDSANHVASVRFSGQIREEAGGPVEVFDEVWHLTKATDGSSGWRIAGIQQFA